MATIIDSLVVELGFGTAELEKGRNVVIDTFKKTKDAAQKAGNQIEDSAKKSGDYVTRLRNNLLGLYAAFTAGRGLKEFVQDMTNSDASLGRFSQMVGQSAHDIAEWRAAGRQMGATAGDIDSTFSSLTSQIQEFNLTGEGTLPAWLRALGISLIDTNNHLKPLTQLLLELSDRVKGMDPAKATAFLSHIGIAPGMIPMILQGRKAVEEMLASQKKLADAQVADIKAAQDRQKAWANLENTLESIGITILNTLTPAMIALNNVLQGFASFFQDNPEIAGAAFAALTAVVLTLSTAIAVNLAAGAIGTAIGAVEALKAGIGGLIFRIGYLIVDIFPALGEAFAVLSAAIETTPIGWIITGIALLGVAAYELYKHWDAIAGWWHSLWGGIGDDAENGSQKAQEAAAKLQHQRDGKAPASSGPQAQADIAAFQKMGWSKAQAEGIVANVQAESGGRTNAVGDNGAAYGLAQWHYDRQLAFEGWAGHSLKDSTRSEQLAFINYELRSRERRAGDALAQATTATQAADIVSRLYERPANVAGASAQRQAIAANLDRQPDSQTQLGAPKTPNPATLPKTPNPAQLILAGSPVQPAGGNNTSSSEVNISTMTINTQATDASGIARDFRGALQQDAMVQQANAGSM